MDCYELIELVSEYLDAELNDEYVEELEGHLELCPHCRALFVSMKTTIESFHVSQEYTVPPAAHRRLKERLIIYSRTIRYRKKY